MKDLVALAKAKPGQLHFASSGSGNTGHLAAELFKKTTATDMVHVPYKGSGPAQVALLSGEVELMFDALPSQLTLVKAGKMKPIAVTAANRAALLPQVPTAIESGFGDFVVEGWYGLVTTAGTPKTIVDKMSADVNAVLRQPEMQRRLAEYGFEIRGTTPEEFGNHVQAEVTRWAAVVKYAGARAD
jgi:tripartite-type tricarboxylate transporter receptor subunit TctC